MPQADGRDIDLERISKMKDIMVDLETLGTGANSAIISIGACYFDEYGIGKTFYMPIDPRDSVQQGLEIDVDHDLDLPKVRHSFILGGSE